MIADKRIGKGNAFVDGWVFDTMPYANIEKKSHQALIVITHDGTWQSPNEHNTARFVRINVDIWASPTRQADGTVIRNDADDLIEEVMEAIRPYLHTVNPSVPGNSTTDPVLPYLGKPGQPRIWGTASQIAAGTGVLVIGSQALNEPTFNDVKDGNGARMARYSFGVATA